MDPTGEGIAPNHDEDEVFEVEKILDMREMNGEKQYLIKWENYDHRCENTWEPENNLNCPELLAAFIRRRRRASRSPSISKTKQSSKSLSSANAARDLDQSVSKPGKAADAVRSGAAGGVAGRPNTTISTTEQHRIHTPLASTSSSSNPAVNVTPVVTNTSQQRIHQHREYPQTTTASAPPLKVRITGSSPNHPNQQTAPDIAPSSENKAQSSPGPSSTQSTIPSSAAPAAPAAPALDLASKPTKKQKSRSPSPAQLPSEKFGRDTISTTSTISSPPSLPAIQTSKRRASKDSSTPPVEQFGRIKRHHRSTDGPKGMDLDELMSKVSNNPTIGSSTSPALPTAKYKSRVIFGSPDPSQPAIARSRSRDPRFHSALGLKPGVHPSPVLPAGTTSAPKPKVPSPVLPHIPVPHEPLSWTGMLYKADEHMVDVTLKSMPGQSPHTNRVRAFLAASERGSGKGRLAITAFLSPNILKKFFDRPASLFSVNPTSQDHRSAYVKFRNFLTTNSITGLIQVEAQPTEVLAILSFTKEIAKGWKLDSWAPENMLAIYLEHMPPPIPASHLHTEIGYQGLLMTHSRKMYQWHLLALVLKFSPQLMERIQPNTIVEIHGTSKWAVVLRRAYASFSSCSNSPATERVILFDRYDQSQFSKNLFEMKRSVLPTTFWEFGIHNLTSRSIIKPIQLYPLLRGGYVMTDIANIIADPDILLRISNAVQQLNANPAGGEWVFVLRYDIFDRLIERATGSPSAKMVQLALILLTNIMSENKCRVMRDWGGQPKENSSDTVRFMEGLARCFCYKAESFVLVDDIASMKEYLAVIETCQSTELYENYKMPRDLH